MSQKYPIRGMLALDQNHLGVDLSVVVAVKAEREVDGVVVAVPIEDHLTPAKDNHGMTYFKFTPKETPTNEPIG